MFTVVRFEATIFSSRQEIFRLNCLWDARYRQLYLHMQSPQHKETQSSLRDLLLAARVQARNDSIDYASFHHNKP